MKKIIIVLLIVFMQVKVVSAQVLDLAPNAKSAILIEASSHKILYQKADKEKMYPASTTKIMTMILMFEAINSGKISFDDVITTSSYAASMGGSQVYLKENEQMTLYDMFKCMAIGSANDATVAIGEYIAGNNDMFVNMMNEKVKAMNLVNTHFKNATGLHDEQHYSCAYDLAMMAAYLIEIGKQQLLDMTSTYDTYVRENTESKFWLVNTNKLLKAYTGLDGLKTGYTKQAGYCLVATALKNNLRIISVVMGETQPQLRNQEVSQMLDYGFNLYEKKMIYKSGELVTHIPIYNSVESSVAVYAKDDIAILLKKGEKFEPSYTIQTIKNIAPFAKGETVGLLNLDTDGTIVSYDLIVMDEVKGLSFLQRLNNAIKIMF